MLDALNLPGNPSSVHAAGRALSAIIEQARIKVAIASAAKPKQVVFTGSATEAITQAIIGGANALGIDQIWISAGEHASALKAAESSGVQVHQIGLLESGLIDMAALEELMQQADAEQQTAMVCVHAVNNETGVIQPIEAIEQLVGPTRHFLFVDAVQAFGKKSLDFAARATDMMAITAHKIGGAVGVGALLVKEHCDNVRLIPGGGQEMSRRGGTQSAALIASFGAAAEAFPSAYDTQRISALRLAIEDGLAARNNDVVIFGADTERANNVVNFALPGLSASVALMGLDLEGVAISSGSACASGKVGPSHVLQAMHVSEELVDCGLRVSLGWSSTDRDVTAFFDALDKVLARHDENEGRAQSQPIRRIS